MSPTDAGRVTDTAASLARLATSLAKLASTPRDADDTSQMNDGPPRKDDFRLFNDPSNYLG